MKLDFFVYWTVSSGRNHYTDEQLSTAFEQAANLHCSIFRDLQTGKEELRKNLIGPLLAGQTGWLPLNIFDPAKFAAQVPLLTFMIEYDQSDNGPPVRYFCEGGRVTHIQQQKLMWAEKEEVKVIARKAGEERMVRAVVADGTVDNVD